MARKLKRGVRLGTLLVGLCATPGCLFSPLSAQLGQARRQLESLEQRISQLEVTFGVEPSGELGTGGTPPGMVSGAAPATVAGPTSALPLGETSSLSDGTPSEARSFQLPTWSFDGRQALSKLTRGLVNLLTGWVEIPKRAHETTQASGPGAGFTYGLLRGLGHAFVRTAGGAYEAATFPFPAPSGYRPIIQPPYVFVCDHPEPAR
jgi:putative exosortase-associated protein (TIGR04073 family)